jgi:fatty acid desaturase
MDAKQVLVPIVLFVCALVAFKALLEAVIRLRLMHRGQSEASMRILLDADRFQRRAGALRTGIALVALACGAGLIEAFGWRDVTPGAVAAIVLPLGIGELIFYFLSQRESMGFKS